MRFTLRQVALALAGAALLSCTETTSVLHVAPSTSANLSTSAAPPPVRFSELHYDNTSTDAGEAIEISGPAGTDLTGWSVVLYNGSGGAPYDTKTLSGTIPAICGTRGVVVVNYAVNGIQNGSPDGMALVSPSGVIEFLSYEGTFAAVGGAANGLTSVDIGVVQNGSEPVGSSLKRSGADVWSATSPLGTNTFGACNDEEAPQAPVASITVAPPEATVTVGGTQQFTATARDAQNNVVSGVTFTWSSTPAATVNATGLATGAEVGDATITATSGTISGNATLHVTAAQPPPTDVHIVEIHYDNVGTDAGESIEIEGPAGASLAGWSVVLYNGNGGVTYNTQNLTGTIPATCGDRGVVVVTYPSNGIQNGNPDGMALVSPTGVVEFLSYEGTFAATNGPANGTTSTNIGVSQDPDNSVPVGLSLQRSASGTWSGPATSSFGACNAAPPAVQNIVINELMADPQNASGGASFGEWFEVFNRGAMPVDLRGWTISSDGQPDHVIASSVVVPAGGFAVLGRSNDATRNGGVTVNYNYFTGSTSTTIFLDATDRLSLKDGTGAVMDAVQWTNASTIVKGVTRALRDANADNTNVDGANWGYSTVHFGDGDFGTPGAANGTLSNTPPAVPNSISFSGRLSSDPALPIGFEDQLFATLRDGAGTTIPTTFTWTSETPSLASIDANGVMRALAEGTATFRATAGDGTTATVSLPMAIATASTTALYGNNVEFGEPKDADASDDFIVRRAQFAGSYNKNRNIPNWVAYNLEATHIGGAVDRCDCFTFDPQLPGTFLRYTTADYTGAGAFHGYGIDRGHLARSFDRTSGALDNATTFYFSNIIPQAADQNQGPWAVLENFLGDQARFQNKEVYVIAGASGSKGTVKNEGKIVIPATTWKVAVIMPRDKGLAHVQSIADLEVIAVIMPNDPGVRNVDWNTYRTTVSAVETLSGYNLLDLLPEAIECKVESRNCLPEPKIVSASGSSTAMAGSPFVVNLSGSDADGVDGPWRLVVDWGDGTTFTSTLFALPTDTRPLARSKTWVAPGTYTIRLTITDKKGGQASTTLIVTVGQ